jgi:ElaB/YqjD/DUF883 family membrane-anchored ribosome-binding protein
MNNERRARLRKLCASIEELTGLISEASQEAEAIRDEEQEAFDNMPESLQQGDRGQASEAAISQLDDAVSDLDSMGESVGDITSKLEEAAA